MVAQRGESTRYTNLAFGGNSVERTELFRSDPAISHVTQCPRSRLLPPARAGSASALRALWMHTTELRVPGERLRSSRCSDLASSRSGCAPPMRERSIHTRETSRDPTEKTGFAKVSKRSGIKPYTSGLHLDMEKPTRRAPKTRYDLTPGGLTTRRPSSRELRLQSYHVSPRCEKGTVYATYSTAGHTRADRFESTSEAQLPSDRDARATVQAYASARCRIKGQPWQSRSMIETLGFRSEDIQARFRGPDPARPSFPLPATRAFPGSAFILPLVSPLCISIHHKTCWTCHPGSRGTCRADLELQTRRSGLE